MKLKKVLLFVAIDVVVLVAGFAFYMDAFDSPPLERSKFASTAVFFSTYRGPYSGIEGAWMRFQGEWEKAGLDKCDAIGIYLDPPGTPEDQLRSILACRLDGLTAEVRNKMTAVFPTFKIPDSATVSATFPYRNKLSFMVAPMRIYPRMQRLIETERLSPAAALETYGPGAIGPFMGFHMLIGLDRSAMQPLMDAFGGQ